MTLSFHLKVRSRDLTFIILSILLLTSCGSSSVKNMGIFPPHGRGNILGHDGCSSIELDNGITMWTFGDTIIGKKKMEITVDSTFGKNTKIIAMPSNSIAFSNSPTDCNISSLKLNYFKKNNRVIKFIKPFKNENIFKWRFWAADGIMLKNRIYVYYMRTEIIKTKSLFPFKVRGMGIAEWKKPANWKIGDKIEFKRKSDLFINDEPTFGDSLFKKKDYLYLIGRTNNRKLKTKGRTSAYFARVSKKNILNREDYLYLNKSGEWIISLKEAKPFFNDIIGEPSISYNKYLKKNIIIYTALDGNLKIVVFESFKELINKKPYTIYKPKKISSKENRSKRYYSGKEIFSTEKAIYAIYINPLNYMPILVKIPYDLLKHDS